MKKLSILLLAMPLLLASCSYEEKAEGEETVKVSFSTELPGMIGTRAGEALSVDKVMCAVFENGVEVSNLRKAVPVSGTDPIVFAPRLIKGRTYSIVFWAMKDGCYDVTDLKAIKRSSGAAASEPDFESFTECVQIEVTGADSKTVTLKRPVAQLNFGVTEEDWNAVADVNTFNLTPKKMVVKTTGKDTFNALEGKATGLDAEITRNLTVSGSDLVADGNTYKSIAMCYVYPDAGQSDIDVKYTVSTEDDTVIRQDVFIRNVPVQANYRTNVVGGLLTGTVTYTISFEEDFGSDNNNVI